MPEDVQRRVGPLASGGYLNYWMRKFPRLLMECYEVVREAELEGSDRFRRYFEMGGGL
jgi:serine/threonine-protein kinase/endoribonuclease IRE1